jgi:ATP:ADP antiporter, AAA family
MTTWLARAVDFRRGEAPLATLAALFHFFVLAGYYFLRPVRDAMGVSGGMDELRWLFTATSIAALIFVIAFGGVVSRTNRRRFIPLAYLFVIVCLLGFAGLLVADARAGGGLIGSDTDTALARAVGYSFYVWLSVINLFITSVLWAFMVDVFDVEQGKRLFPFVGVGGTLGGLFASKVAKLASQSTHTVYLPVGLMLTGATFFAAAIAVMLWLDRTARRSAVSRLSGGAPALGESSARASDEPIGGSLIEGLTAVLRSPYLLGIGGHIVLMAVSSTLIYFSGAHVVLENAQTFDQRVRSFAEFDTLAQTATLLTQLFITSRLIRRVGVGWTLAVLPLLTLLGFATLAIWPVFGVMAVFQALQRAARYAVARPSRETLFSVVPVAEKYKAKPVIDVFLYRGGDLAGAGLDGLLKAWGLGLTGLAAATLPIAAVWTALSLAMGRAQARRQKRGAARITASKPT